MSGTDRAAAILANLIVAGLAMLIVAYCDAPTWGWAAVGAVVYSTGMAHSDLRHILTRESERKQASDAS